MFSLPASKPEKCLLFLPNKSKYAILLQPAPIPTPNIPDPSALTPILLKKALKID